MRHQTTDQLQRSSQIYHCDFIECPEWTIHMVMSDKSPVFIELRTTWLCLHAAAHERYKATGRATDYSAASHAGRTALAMLRTK